MSVYRKEDAVGKTVISHEGKVVGVVKDIGFSLDGTGALVVHAKDGQELTIPIHEIFGMADYVVMKPRATHILDPNALISPPAMSSPSICPRCQSPTKPGTKFCNKCGNRLVA